MFNNPIFWVLITLFLVFIFAMVWRIYPKKGALYFYNSKGKFELYDIVYDRGSATRPNQPGVLKYSQEEEHWFLIYEDGFEWPLSEFKNIELFIYQTKK